MQKKRVIVLVVIIVLLIVGGIVAFLLMNSNNTTDWSTGSNGQSGKNLEFEENDDSMVTIKSVTMPGWDTISIEAGTQDVRVDFYNPSNNAGKFHMTFELKLANGESLYKSGLVKAGDHVRNIKLTRALAPGTYDAVVHIQPYSADEQLSAKNNANVNIKLIAA